MLIDYIEIISHNYPGTQCSINGDPSIYSNISWGSSTPILQTNLNSLVLQYNQNNTWKLISTERDRRRINGGYKVGTDWFHSDNISRIQQLGLLMFGANMPTGIMWKTMASTFISMTPTLATQIFQSAAASDQNVFTVAEQKKSAMLALADPTTYDYLTGWPLIFGE